MLLTKKTDETKFHSGCDLQAVESTTELYFTRNIQKRVDNCDGRTRFVFQGVFRYNKYIELYNKYSNNRRASMTNITKYI